LAACARLPIDGVAIPKVAAPEDLRRIAPAVDAAERRQGRRWTTVAILESVAGIANARQIAAAAVPGTVLAFGAEDFATEMGARRTPEGTEVLHARSEVVLAARLHGLVALDQVVVEVRDDARFAADAKTGRDLGYDGKMCLTPRQVELANDAFAPSAEEIALARRLIAAFEAASKGARGAIDFEGRMVDAPLVERARRLLAKAGG
jgi:citrate lyase subunit beta/citryl-CoA lyase